MLVLYQEMCDIVHIEYMERVVLKLILKESLSPSPLYKSFIPPHFFST